MSSDNYGWHYDYARLAFDTGFSFETFRSKSLDKIIGPINVDHIIKDRDVLTIEKYIPAVVEFSLDNDQTSVLDPTFVKIFKLSQLSVQYLIFCRKYLDNSVVLIKHEYQKGNEENKNLKRQIDELNLEASNYKKQIKELKATLNTQIAANHNTGVFQCQECPKAFSTEEYLLAHIKRRHESVGIVGTPSNTAFQTETDKLQLEIKQLKDRLNNTERFVSHNEFLTVKEYTPKPNTEQNTFVTELQEKFEYLKTHVDSELNILHTQKFEKEKYEKWFETFLIDKLNLLHNINEKPITTTTGTQGEIIANNCSTQTESFGLSLTVACETCQNRKQNLPSNGNLQNQGNQIENKVHDAEALEEKLHQEAQNQLQKFEELLETKVTGSIEKLENQMHTFLVKINDIEEQRTKMKLNAVVDNLKEDTPKIPRPRKQMVLVKNTSTSPMPMVSKNIEHINNKHRLSTTDTAKKPVAANGEIKAVIVKKFYSSSSESEEESNSNESETENDQEVVINKPVVKISATSTLGRRSLTSLKEVAFSQKVLSQLQKEVEKVLQTRLQEIGVTPKSKGIPVRSYQRALGIVTHQASIVQKNISNYMQIRRQILKDVDTKVSECKTSSSKNSKLKTLLSNFRAQTGKIKSPQLEQRPHIPQSRNANNPNTVVGISVSEVISPSNSRFSNTIVLKQPPSNLKNSTNISLESTDSENVHSPEKISTFAAKPLGNINLVSKPELVNDPDAQTKGVLKNFAAVGSLPKKKVIFDLASAASKENFKPILQTKTAEGGSTTSIASSVLDISKASLVETHPPSEKKKRETYDSSDWELSEVSTN